MRTTINNEFEKAFTPKYTFYAGFIADKINGTQIKFPLAWLNPPDITEVSSRSDGTRQYNATLYLMSKDDKFNEQQKAECWQQMERDGIKAFRQMVDDANGRIEEIMNIRSEPNEYAYTGYSELAVKITFDMIVQYCEDEQG